MKKTIFILPVIYIAITNCGSNNVKQKEQDNNIEQKRESKGLNLSKTDTIYDFSIDTSLLFATSDAWAKYKNHKDSLLFHYARNIKTSGQEPDKLQAQHRLDSIWADKDSKTDYLLYKYLVTAEKSSILDFNELYFLLSTAHNLVSDDQIKQLFESYPEKYRKSEKGKKIYKALYETGLNTGKNIVSFNDKLLYENKTETNFKQLLLNNKHKYLLILFGASWCSPCRYESMSLKQELSKIDTAMIEIAGISLDDNFGHWTNFLNDFKSPWQQYILAKGFQSQLAESLQIKGIPYTIVLNNNREIIFESKEGVRINKILEFLSKLS
jgi:thiol-disulfide isomerase/thioredoxin